jgi:hypothetical protein
MHVLFNLAWCFNGVQVYLTLLHATRDTVIL